MPPYARLAGHDDGTWDRTQSWAICATEPGQYGDRMPGRACTRPGPVCSRQPYSLADREIRAAGQLACRRFPFPRVP